MVTVKNNLLFVLRNLFSVMIIIINCHCIVIPLGLSQLCNFFDKLCYSFMLHLLPIIIMLQKCTNCSPRNIMLQKYWCGLGLGPRLNGPKCLLGGPCSRLGGVSKNCGH